MFEQMTKYYLFVDVRFDNVIVTSNFFFCLFGLCVVKCKG
jgi:hypothetical protein